MSAALELIERDDVVVSLDEYRKTKEPRINPRHPSVYDPDSGGAA